MLNVVHFRDLIIRPTLKHLGLESEAAVELLLGTAIQESRLTYLKQLGEGPALGVYQVEPATHDDAWDNYLVYRKELAVKVAQTCNRHRCGRADEMVGNLWYATAMARVHYLRVPHPLPAPGDVDAMAAYWKRWYNTHEGAGTEEEYIENWNEATFGL